jgi:phospholipid transport system substrate-binding protein
MFRFMAIAVFLSLLALPTHADEAARQPSQVVSNFGNEALHMLSETVGNPERREGEFRRLLMNSFDVSAMARTIAGRYWVRATEAEQAEYLRLFEDYLVRIHAQRLGQYFGAAIRLEGEQSEGPDTFVTTSVEQPNKAPILVVWRVANRADAYKIVDVSVSGVSLLLTHRSEFMAVMQNGGGKLVSLFPPLRQKIGAAR